MASCKLGSKGSPGVPRRDREVPRAPAAQRVDPRRTRRRQQPRAAIRAVGAAIAAPAEDEARRGAGAAVLADTVVGKIAFVGAEKGGRPGRCESREGRGAMANARE